MANIRTCEVRRNAFFGYHSLPVILVSLLLHQHCTSDSSCCICLSLLLGIEKFIDSLASELKGLFFLHLFCVLQIKPVTVIVRKLREWGGTRCQVCQRVCRAKRGWGAEGNWRIVSSCSGAGSLVCHLGCFVWFVSVWFFGLC